MTVTLPARDHPGRGTRMQVHDCRLTEDGRSAPRWDPRGVRHDGREPRVLHRPSRSDRSSAPCTTRLDPAAWRRPVSCLPHLPDPQPHTRRPAGVPAAADHGNDRAADAAAYDAEIRYTDDVLAHFLAGLDAAGAGMRPSPCLDHGEGSTSTASSHGNSLTRSPASPLPRPGSRGRAPHLERRGPDRSRPDPARVARPSRAATRGGAEPRATPPA